MLILYRNKLESPESAGPAPLPKAVMLAEFKRLNQKFRRQPLIITKERDLEFEFRPDFDQIRFCQKHPLALGGLRPTGSLQRVIGFHDEIFAAIKPDLAGVDLDEQISGLFVVQYLAVSVAHERGHIAFDIT